MKTSPVFAALLALATVSACGGPDKMVGVWKVELAQELKQMQSANKPAEPFEIEFKPDSTIVARNVFGPQPKDNLIGTYSLSGQELQLRVTPGKDPSVKPESQALGDLLTWEITVVMAKDMKSFEIPSYGKFTKQ
ncbi:MAG: hypothetical protein ABL962_09045 [Fimbriimonadaceae bacterium]